MSAPRKSAEASYGRLAIELILAAAMVWFVMDGWVGPRVDPSPPPEVHDIDSFLARMARPRSAYELESGESRFIEFLGPTPETGLPSGPPAYVFDESRRLVDWSPDTGEDPDFEQQWHVDTERRALSPEELRERLDEGR